MEEELVIVFENALSAIICEQEALAGGIAVRVMPMPSSLGPSCGIALRISPGDIEKTRGLLGDKIKGIYKKTESGEYRSG